MAKTMVVDPPGEGLEPACPACCDGYIGRHNTICQECGGPIYDKIIGLGELLFEYGHIPQVGMKDHDNLLKQVDQLRTDGESWFTISRKLGCDIDAIRVYWGWHLAEMGQMAFQVSDKIFWPEWAKRMLSDDLLMEADEEFARICSEIRENNPDAPADWLDQTEMKAEELIRAHFFLKACG